MLKYQSDAIVHLGFIPSLLQHSVPLSQFSDFHDLYLDIARLDISLIPTELPHLRLFLSWRGYIFSRQYPSLNWKTAARVVSHFAKRTSLETIIEASLCSKFMIHEIEFEECLADLTTHCMDHGLQKYLQHLIDIGVIPFLLDSLKRRSTIFSQIILQSLRRFLIYDANRYEPLIFDRKMRQDVKELLCGTAPQVDTVKPVKRGRVMTIKRIDRTLNLA